MAKNLILELLSYLPFEEVEDELIQYDDGEKHSDNESKTIFDLTADMVIRRYQDKIEEIRTMQQDLRKMSIKSFKAKYDGD